MYISDMSNIVNCKKAVTVCSDLVCTFLSVNSCQRAYCVRSNDLT